MAVSLRPVGGDPLDLYAKLVVWLDSGGAADPLIVRTSGSTGEPKDVVLSRDALLASATATHERLGGAGQWWLGLPTTGVAGLQVLVRSVLAGRPPVTGDITEAVAAMDRPRAYASLVPTQLHRLATSGQLGALASFDAVLIGGASLRPDLLAAARDAGVTIVRTYGMSETCGGCVYDGIPLRDVELRIDHARNVFLRGPVLFDGYGGRPDATAAVMRDGWFATADLGELDADGRLRILGRGDDVVISGGVNVSLPAVTQALLAAPGVHDGLALGIPDPEWGSRVVAFVVAHVGTESGPNLETLRDTVESAGLPRTWAPREVMLLDELPLLPGGKVDRQQLLALAVRRAR
ncbi:hypothetical protein BH09ACT10_BH09ACT10_21120 [soil metagenome]